MGSKNDPPYRVGESWEDFLARRGIERDKAEPIHEIQWLRSERIRLMVEVERHRMTEAERGAIVNAIACCEDITYGGPADPGAAGVLIFSSQLKDEIDVRPVDFEKEAFTHFRGNPGHLGLADRVCSGQHAQADGHGGVEHPYLQGDARG